MATKPTLQMDERNNTYLRERTFSITELKMNVMRERAEQRKAT